MIEVNCETDFVSEERVVPGDRQELRKPDRPAQPADVAALGAGAEPGRFRPDR